MMKQKKQAANIRVDDAEAAFKKAEELARHVLSVPKSDLIKSKKRRKRA